MSSRIIARVTPDAYAVTATRASTAYQRGATGTIAAVAANALRDAQYVKNNATGLYERAILLERGRSNGFTTYSTDLSQAAWTKVGVLSTTMTATGPDGVANSASHLVEDTSTGVHSVVRQCAFTAGSVQSCSVWLKPFGPQQRPWRLKWEMASPFTDAMGVDFDPSTQTATAYARGASALPIVQCVQGSGGWWRVLFSGILNAASTTGSITVQGLDPGVSASYTGDGVSGVDVYNVQPEIDAPFPTSDMPTGAAGFTRAVDLASIDLTGTALATPKPFSVYTKYIYQRSTPATPYWRLWAFQLAATGQNAALVYVNGSGQAVLRWWNGASAFVDTSSAGMPVPAIGDQVEVLARVDAAGVPHCTMTVNGGTPITADGASGLAFAPAWSASTLNLNAADGAGTQAGILALQAMTVSVDSAPSNAFPRAAGAVPALVTPMQFPGALQSWGASGKGQSRAVQNMGRAWDEVYAVLDAGAANVRALLAALNRGWREGVVWAVQHPYWKVNAGALGGYPPLVRGAGQTGNTLLVKGCPASVTGYLKAGDVVAVAGGAVVLDVTADVDTDAAGWASIGISPPIFAGRSPADGALVTVDAAQIYFQALITALGTWPDIDSARLLAAGLTVSWREQPQ
jgi:hypothetical protein